MSETTNANNVSVGKPKIGGAIFTAPEGTTLPAYATSPLDAKFACLGYASDEGVVNSVDASSEDITAWGGDKVLSVRTSYSETFQYTLIEAKNIHVLRSVYGDENVEGELESGIHVKHTSEELPIKSWVFEVVLSGGALKRIVVPSGKVSEVGEVTYTSSDPIGYNTTISAFPDAAGVTAHEYIIEKKETQDKGAQNGDAKK